MEFLKDILGDDLYNQIETKINEHNGNEANKDKQIKLGNLGSGEYVGKGKYDSLQALLDGKNTELESANSLIEQLKKGTKDNEGLQGKITAYETQVAQLQAQLAQTQIDAAIKVGLLSEKALDVDYLTFKLKEKGELEIDENGKIKGWDDKIAALKTQLPTQFEGAGSRKFQEHKLPDNNNQDNGLTKSDILKMPYAERAKLYSENEEAYKSAMNSKS